MKPENLCAWDYHPAFSSMLIDHWRRFDGARTGAELDDLRRRHPTCGAVRIHHAYEAWLRDPKGYYRTWETLLDLCASRDLRVIACLFNRWHDRRLDCGGIYLENLVPGLSWAWKEGFYAPFLDAVCGEHAGDARVVIWESCDKPFGAARGPEDDPCDGWRYERRWLRELYCYVKQLEPDAPVGISVRRWYGAALLEALSDSCDVLLRSPCYMNAEQTARLMAARFEKAGPPMLTVNGD